MRGPGLGARAGISRLLRTPSRRREIRAHALGALSLVLVVGCSEPTEGTRSNEAASTDDAALQTKLAKSDVVWAASSRVRVLRGSRVVARMDLDKAVTGIAFAEGGARPLVATSGGLLAFEGAQVRTGRRITHDPVRAVHVAHRRVWVLEHTVTPGPAGEPVPSPYRIREIDASSLTTVRTVEVGERVLAFAPPPPPPLASKRVLLVHESGAVRAIDWPSGQGEPLPPPGGGRLRQFVALSKDGTHAFLGVEGSAAAIIDYDLATMRSRRLRLGRAAPIRGLAATPDGRAVLVNALRHVARVPLDGGTIRWAHLEAAHQGAALTADGRRLWLGRPVDGDGGSVLALDTVTLGELARIPIADISPFVVAVPR